MPRRHHAALLLAALLCGQTVALADECPAAGEWRRQGEAVAPDALLRELAEQRVVLLGEQHERLAHHRWQLHTLAALHGHQPNLAIGLEMLPREAQPALDAWVAGELDETAFLESSDWHDAWGYDPDLYLPILHFARMHRVPLVALNVTPELRRRLATEGWEEVPAAERHGLTAPAPASPEYRTLLTETYAEHPSETAVPGGFERFIDAQLVWDRAMAEGLADASEHSPLVVGLMGEGHVRHGHGVPHQLDALGITAQRTLLAWSPDQECPPPAAIADALFGLGDEARHEPASPMRLGVMIVPDPAGVRVARVEPDSVAQASGLHEDDIISAAAGRPLGSPGELIDLVRRQAPGTLLPLEVVRDGEIRELLARFPGEAP
ncbi:ChaN family lipoprotein [Halomonas sp. SSL-5]|uniref:ChaN family lipoprotein n=1 Tax=Halomonas sp. SSL-5 TaxID=3065855 RepID=UPI002739E621|nr:ChaN family lipoprotein [Halomonas sp. SSL-5]MDY7115202.1 ChaN family lipoprotein [Halomonas sp. SSL-5]